MPASNKHNASNAIHQVPVPYKSNCSTNHTRPFDNGWWEEYQNKIESNSQPKPQLFQLSAKFGFQDPFEREVKIHKHYALETQLFDSDNVFEYYHYPDFILQDPTWEQHLQYLQKGGKGVSRRGGGFWFWKAALIHHHLSSPQMATGDFLIYVDVDVWEHYDILPDLLREMVRYKKNFCLQEMPDKLEREWTKRDVYEAYCHRSPHDDNQSQMDAMFLVLRKDMATLQLAFQFLEASKFYHAISDETTWVPNIPHFQKHRRDQSLLNLLLKCRYQEPGRQQYNHHDRTCSWGASAERPLVMYELPEFTRSKLQREIATTKRIFRQQQRRFQRATSEALENSTHPYWSSSYLDGLDREPHFVWDGLDKLLLKWGW